MAERMNGRVPPNDNDAERALLGAVLLRNSALDTVAAGLSSEDFYQEGHKLIWEAICDFRNERKGIVLDIFSLSRFMSEKGSLDACGGANYISGLTDSVPSSSNAEYYAELIKAMSMRRQILEFSVRMGDMALDRTQDVRQSVDSIDERLNALVQRTGMLGQYVSAKAMLMPTAEDITYRSVNGITSGLSTGFPMLDSYTGGFKPSDFIIIGARPSVGKTALAISIARNMALDSDTPAKVGFFSLEMSGASLIERILSAESCLNSRALRDGKLSKEKRDKLIDVAGKLYEKADNLLIQDTPNMNLMDIRSQARQMVLKDKVRAIFIDYIGLIESGMGGNVPRHEQIGKISRSLKSLARELKIPVICLSQVNREAGKDRPPILADLRESGSIEQDADLVILLDDAKKRLNEQGKVDEYSQDDIQAAEDDYANTKQIKIIIAKQRNGSTGAFNLNFQSSYVSFTSIERGPVD